MAQTITINSLDALKPYLNDKRVIEVVTRDKNKKYKQFFNLALNEDAINDVTKNSRLLKDQQKLIKEVVHAVGNNTAMSEKSVHLLETASKLQGVGLALNVLNLGATCAGFAIMNKKLNMISGQISQKMDQLQETMKLGNILQAERDFNEARTNHENMLDCRRLQKPLSEEKMWALVDKEYNTLSSLISIFQKDISSDKQVLFTMILSLLSMFTAALKIFDELYFVENCGKLTDTEVVHTSHDRWMNIYDSLISREFVEYHQDYAVFEMNMNTREADSYYKFIISCVTDGKQEVEDNLILMNRFKDMNLLNLFRDYEAENFKKEIGENIEEILQNTGKEEFKLDFDKLIAQAIATY